MEAWFDATTMLCIKRRNVRTKLLCRGALTVEPSGKQSSSWLHCCYGTAIAHSGTPCDLLRQHLLLARARQGVDSKDFKICVVPLTWYSASGVHAASS